MNTSISGIGTTIKSEAGKKIGTHDEPKSERSSHGEESTVEVFFQTMIPFIIAGLGSICAGLLLNRVQKTHLVCEVPQFIAMCPPLQGMKGNLDMTFTSRLSTEAHQGRLERSSRLVKHILMNMALIQAQAVGISLFAALITFALNALETDAHEEIPVKNFLFLGSNALFAMSAACLISSTALVFLVVLTYTFSINPDNVATPLASSFGDLLTIGAMIGVATQYHPLASISIVIPISVICCFIVMVPFWLYVAHHDEHAWVAARQQGPTFFLAAILSSGAGIIQAFALKSFPELTVYQPLITGVAGNRAGLQSARISSYINTYQGVEKLTPRFDPWDYYTSPDPESRTALLILLTSPPYHLLFVFVSHTIAFLAFEPLKLSFVFIAGYMCTVLIQIFFLVYISQIIVYSLHRFGVDPDMHAIPMVTSIGDLVGTSLLFALFYVMSFGDDFVLKSSTMSEEPSNATTICSYE
ncbi:hypothetical protein RB195_019920 [Necator americanus]